MAPAPAPRSVDPPSGLIARVQALRSSDVGKASGLAIAMIVNNVVALLATVLFARVLDDYGSLAALLSFVLILSVVGQAMQVATAREAVLGTLGTGAVLATTLRSWTRTLLIATVVAAVIGVLLRQPIADAVGVDETWAAAAGLPAGVLWLLLATLRGGLQGVGDYKAVGVSLIGEQCVRLISGVALAAVGLDVTGAFLGTPISLGLLAIWCGLELRKRIRAGGAEAAAGTPQARAANAAAQRPDGHLGPAVRLRDHIVNAWAPITGLIIIAVLQNIDVIGAKHRFSDDVASSYSATAVAAKVLIWVSMGAGFYLVPETSRRHSEGQDTRPVLVRAIGIVLVCAVPVLLIFIAVPRLLIRLAFGADRLLAVDALLPLGIAFTLLAITYLAIQYLLALRRTRFLIPLGIVAAAEPVLLLVAAPKDPDGFSVLVLAIQAVAVVVALAIAFKRPSDRSPAPSRHAPPRPAAAESTPRG